MQAYFRCLRPLRRFATNIGLVLRVSASFADSRDGYTSCVREMAMEPPLT
jgi:hypothetical protein